MNSPWWYPGLFAASFVAGFVDSIAGGGGLITVPALLAAGLSPTQALGTNKLQASFGSGSAAWHFKKAGLIAWREVRLGMAVSFLSAMLGAWAVQQISPEFLRRLIPTLLMGLAVFILVRPRFGLERRGARMGGRHFAVVFGLGLGFYDGFFGPGTGSFWALACVALLGLDLTRATAYTKAMNFASNLGALLVFLAGGQVVVFLGLVMGLGQWAGAWAGSHLVIHRGARLIRPVFVVVCLILAVKLLVTRSP
jgi:uncharacterized protein